MMVVPAMEVVLMKPCEWTSRFELLPSICQVTTRSGFLQYFRLTITRVQIPNNQPIVRSNEVLAHKQHLSNLVRRIERAEESVALDIPQTNDGTMSERGNRAVRRKGSRVDGERAISPARSRCPIHCMLEVNNGWNSHSYDVGRLAAALPVCQLAFA